MSLDQHRCESVRGGGGFGVVFILSTIHSALSISAWSTSSLHVSSVREKIDVSSSASRGVKWRKYFLVDWIASCNTRSAGRQYPFGASRKRQFISEPSWLLRMVLGWLNRFFGPSVDKETITPPNVIGRSLMAVSHPYGFEVGRCIDRRGAFS